jgi:hypothetical protein
MRTVLSGIPFFSDTRKIVEQHFISNRSGGEESKIAERERARERERMCVVRQHVVEKDR